MKRTLILLAALFSLGGNCGHVGPKPVEPTDIANCAGACQHLRDLGCPEGEPLEDGTTCTAFCDATQGSGHAMRPSCVVNLVTCESFEEVCMSEPRQPGE